MSIPKNNEFMNSGKYLITYTIKDRNNNALEKIEILLAEYGFKPEKDQSTYLGGNKATLSELQERICAIRQYIKQGEHITLYYVEDSVIKRSH